MILAILAGCTGGSGNPRNFDLVGLWTTEEPGEYRALSFAPLDSPEPSGLELAYDFYLYGDFTPPVVVQSGFAGVDWPEDPDFVVGTLVYDVREDVNPGNIFVRFGSDFEPIDRDSVRIQDRVYTRAEELYQPEIPTEFGGVLGLNTGRALGNLLSDAEGTLWTSSILGPDVVVQRLTTTGSVAEGLVELRPLVSVGTDLGGHLFDAATWGRFTPTFDGIELGFEAVWTREDDCQRLVTSADRWVGYCRAPAPDALAVLGPEGATPAGAILWFDPETGDVVAGRWASTTAIAMYPLGDDVLIIDQGPSATPERHGTAEGMRHDRVGPDGRVVWSTWTPSSLSVAHATAVGDHVVMGTTAAAIIPGGFPLDPFAQRNRFVAFDADGQLSWSMDTHGLQTPIPGGVGDTFLYAFSSYDAAEGGPTVEGSTDYSSAVALHALDKCGNLRQRVAYPWCGYESLQRSTALGTVIRTPDDRVALTLQTGGTACFGSGRIFSQGLLRIVPPDPVSPTCEIPAANRVEDPVLTVEIEGDGAVEVAGQVCTSTCTIPLTLFTEEPVSVTPAEGHSLSGFSGICNGVGDCVVHAYTPELSLTVRFVPQGAEAYPWAPLVNATVGANGSVVFVGHDSPTTEVLDLGGQTVVGWGTDHGTFHRPGVAVRPGSDEVVAASNQPNEFHRFNASGWVETVPVPSSISFIGPFAVDASGLLLAAQAQSSIEKVVAFDATGERWSIALSPHYPLAVTGRTGGGFAVLINGVSNQPFTIGDLTLPPAANASAILLMIDSAGTVTAAERVANGQGAFVVYRSLEDDGAGGVWLIRENGDLTAEHRDAAGLLLSTVVLAPANLTTIGAHRDGSGFVLTGHGSPASGGFGGNDVLVQRYDSAGTALVMHAAGGPNNDQVRSSARASDGSVWVLADDGVSGFLYRF